MIVSMPKYTMNASTKPGTTQTRKPQTGNMSAAVAAIVGNENSADVAKIRHASTKATMNATRRCGSIS